MHLPIKNIKIRTVFTVINRTPRAIGQNLFSHDVMKTPLSSTLSLYNTTIEMNTHISFRSLLSTQIQLCFATIVDARRKHTKSTVNKKHLRNIQRDSQATNVIPNNTKNTTSVLDCVLGCGSSLLVAFWADGLLLAECGMGTFTVNVCYD